MEWSYFWGHALIEKRSDGHHISLSCFIFFDFLKDIFKKTKGERYVLKFTSTIQLNQILIFCPISFRCFLRIGTLQIMLKPLSPLCGPVSLPEKVTLLYLSLLGNYTIILSILLLHYYIILLLYIVIYTDVYMCAYICIYVYIGIHE